MARKRSQYTKYQTKWSRLPAVLSSARGDDTVMIQVRGEWRSDGPAPSVAMIALTAQEAQGFAAWLSEQAEHLLAKQARAVARKLARLESKNRRDS